MRIASKATKGKGKRWKKGSSSSCNPTTKKFRSLARSCTFKNDDDNKNEAKSLLTEDFMAQYNAIQLKDLRIGNKNDVSDNDIKSGMGIKSDMDIEDREDIEEISENQSVGSFGTVLTSCTNVSFSKFLNKWKPRSALHREMLAVLGAVSETIRDKGGHESETEYFAALMTTLESVEHDEALTAIVSLLSMVIRTLPPSVIKIKFSETSKVLLEYLSRYVESDNGVLVRSLISCIGSLLKHQELAVWHLRSTQLVYETILSLTIHSKPRIRKTAHRIVVGILNTRVDNQNHNNNPPVSCHPVSALTSQFCIRKIEELNIKENINIALYSLQLISHVISVFPSHEIKKSCETMLRLMTLGQTVIVTCSYKVFYQLFNSYPDGNLLTSELNAQIISALYEYQPNINDVQLICSWTNVMQKAYLNLNKTNPQLCASHLSRLFSVLVPIWLSESHQVHTCVADTVRQIYTRCIEPSLESIESETLGKIFKTLLSALHSQYYNAWGTVLDVVGHCINDKFSNLFLSSLVTIADMRDENNFPYVSELENVYARAVKLLGPRVVIDSCNIDLTGDSDLTNTWLLVVLRDNIDKSELAFFVQYFLPAANQLKKKSLFYQNQNQEAKAKTLNILYDQIWSLFPSFCLNPTDLCSSFKLLARTLGVVLSEQSDLRHYALSGLKNLISRNSNLDHVKYELAKYAKNFIPILFNLYTEESVNNEHRLKTYELIQLYFHICQDSLLSSFYLKVKEKLDKSDNDFLHCALLDLLKLFIPFVKKKDIDEIYNIANTNIKKKKDKYQKKGFLTIEEICKNQTKTCQVFVGKNLQNILTNLIQSLSTCSDSAKFSLLRSIKNIIESNFNNSDNLEKIHRSLILILTNVIECLMSNRERLTLAASSLLVSMCQGCKIIKSTGHEQFLQFVLNSLNDQKENHFLTSAIISALTKLFNHFFNEISSFCQKAIIERVLEFTKTNHRTVIKVTLEFLKSLLTNTQEFLFPYIEVIVKSLLNIHGNHKSHFRNEFKFMLVRLIRKFSYELVSKMIPNTGIYGKILKNIRKTETRKKLKSNDRDDESEIIKKKKNQSIEDIIDDSESSENEDDFDVRPKQKNKNQYWIEENKDDGEVLDLMDVKSFKNVLSTNPEKNKTKQQKQPFELTSDGKIIIENEQNDKGMKRKIDDVDNEFDEEVNNEDNLNDKELPKYQPGGRGIHRRIKTDYGEDYKSKRARGDMKKKGKLDPYAYIPLNRQVLNKRKKAKFKGQFKNIVKSAKKGAFKGKRINKKSKRK